MGKAYTNLSKYLSRLAGKGEAEARLAEAANRSMRWNILDAFDRMTPGGNVARGKKQAFRLQDEAGAPQLWSRDHPDLSQRQLNAVYSAMTDKLEDVGGFKKWTEAGQPSGDELASAAYGAHTSGDGALRDKLTSLEAWLYRRRKDTRGY